MEWFSYIYSPNGLSLCSRCANQGITNEIHTYFNNHFGLRDKIIRHNRASNKKKENCDYYEAINSLLKYSVEDTERSRLQLLLESNNKTPGGARL